MTEAGLSENQARVLAELEARLDRSRRLEALGQLTGSLAHDFNNLLMIVLGNAEILEDMALRGGEIKPERLLRVARTVLSAADRGSKLTQNLLKLTRQPTSPSGPVAVHRHLQDLADLLRQNLGRGISLAFDLAADADLVAVDSAAIENAIITLVLNRRDAMGARGQMTISTRNLTAETDGARQLAIVVEDSGPEAVADEQTGFGLALDTARRTGGALHIAAGANGGSVVTLTMPVARQTAEKAIAASAASKAPPLARPRVLVVDDDASVLSVMVAQLSRLGCDTVSAESAERALDLIQSSGDFDLLFSDIDLGPGRDGFALAGDARLKRPALPIILTTGKVLDHEGRERIDGIPPILPKPFTQRELAEKLRDVLGYPAA